MSKPSYYSTLKWSAVISVLCAVCVLFGQNRFVGAQVVCYTAWDASTPYTDGAQLSNNGNNYTFAWLGSTISGAIHEPGKAIPGIWTDEGACGDHVPNPPPMTSTPTPTTPSGDLELCVGAPFDSTVSNYNQDDFVFIAVDEETGMNYQAKSWTAAEPGGPRGNEEWIEVGPCQLPPPPPPLKGPVKIYNFIESGVYARDHGVADLAPLVEAGHINLIQYAYLNLEVDGNCALHDYWAADERPGKAPYEQLGNLRQLAALRDDYPNDLKVVLSIGGWTLSTWFSDVAADPGKVATMVSSCMDIIQTYRFDGLNIAWEYPGSCGLCTGWDYLDDGENFINMAAEFRARLDEAEVTDGKQYLLTAAVPATEWKMDEFEMGDLAQHIDYLSLHSYDFNGTWQEMPAHSAPLYQTPEDPRIGTDAASQNSNQDHAVRMYLDGGKNLAGEMIQGGVPPEKLLLGLPFYGRSWANVPPDELIPGLPGLFGTSNNGRVDFTGLCNCEPDYREMSSPMWDSREVRDETGESSGGSWEEGIWDYDDIVNRLIPNGYTRYWDDAAQVPYVYNPNMDGGTLISYDDAQSIGIKTQYAIDNCLGGIMVWETSGNNESSDLYDAVTNRLGDYDPENCEPVQPPLAVRVNSHIAQTDSLLPSLIVSVTVMLLTGMIVGRVAFGRE